MGTCSQNAMDAWRHAKKAGMEEELTGLGMVKDKNVKCQQQKKKGGSKECLVLQVRRRVRGEKRRAQKQFIQAHRWEREMAGVLGSSML